MSSEGLLAMQDMFNVCLRNYSREQYFKQMYRLILAKVFNLVDINMDNAVYEWQVAFHEVYTVDEFEQIHGVLVTFNPLHKIRCISIYEHGRYKCDIDPATIIAKLHRSASI